MSQFEDFSNLPTDILIEYLIDLSYEEVINFCSTSTSARNICQLRRFWNKKALHDFGVPLRLAKGDNPQKQYYYLYNLYENDTEALINLIIDHDLLNVTRENVLLYLLNKSELISENSRGRTVVNENIYPLLYDAAKNLKITKIIDKYLTEHRTPIENALWILIYYIALLHYRDGEVFKYLRERYNEEPNSYINLVFVEALKMGDLDIIKYLLPKIQKRLGADDIVPLIIEHGKENVVDYMRTVYPGLFDDIGFINNLVRYYIYQFEPDNLRRVIEIAGDIIDFDKAERHANNIRNRIDREEIMKQLKAVYSY